MKQIGLFDEPEQPTTWCPHCGLSVYINIHQQYSTEGYINCKAFNLWHLPYEQEKIARRNRAGRPPDRLQS